MPIARLPSRRHVEITRGCERRPEHVGRKVFFEYRTTKREGVEEMFAALSPAETQAAMQDVLANTQRVSLAA